MSNEQDQLMDDVLAAYEDATGQLPDTRDYVAIENVVKDYTDEVNKKQ